MSMTDERACEIVSLYGEMLSSMPGELMDVAVLPFAKSEIKAAILRLMQTAEGKTREALKIGYMSLSKWQDGYKEIQEQSFQESQRLVEELKALGEWEV